VNAARLERAGAADVIFVVRIAAVDDRVAGLQAGRQLADHLFRGLAGRHHEPDGARQRQRAYEVVE